MLIRTYPSLYCKLINVFGLAKEQEEVLFRSPTPLVEESIGTPPATDALVDRVSTR